MFCTESRELAGIMFDCVNPSPTPHIHYMVARTRVKTEPYWQSKILGLGQFSAILAVTCFATAIVGIITLGR